MLCLEEKEQETKRQQRQRSVVVLESEEHKKTKRFGWLVRSFEKTPCFGSVTDVCSFRDSRMGG